MYMLVISVVVALLLATVSIYRYGNVQRQHPIVTLSVLIAWSFSFLIVFIIPLDVTSVRKSTSIAESKVNFLILLCFRLSIGNVSTSTM